MSDNETEKHTPGVPSNWRYNPPNQANSASMALDGDGPSINPSPSSLGSTSTMDTFPQPPPVWENTHSQFLGYNVMNLQNVASSSDDLMMKTGLLLPNSSTVLPHHSLSPFPTDSAFIERAARFSCFSSETMVDMMNPFGIHQSVINHYDRGVAQNNLSSASHNVLFPEEEGGRQNSGGFHQEATKHSESVKAETAGCEEEGLTPLPLKDTDARVSSSEGLHFRKRKRLGQDTETEESPHQADKAEKDNGDNKRSSPCPDTNKNSGKNGKQSSDASDQPKEDYIHIRARRGQATNSHSLAERVRREKISERMKFLQDLVPGCNKVTGKAVMLDEIINYVQSLQRQVEFLSMKLSTVNPRLNFDIESFLDKDPMFGALAGPASWGLAPDMHMGNLRMHPPEQSHTPPNLAPTSDALRNITSQLIGVSAGYKAPTCQPPNAWDDELHNVVQMGFNPAAAHSSGNHDKETNTDGNLPTGLMKVEL